MADTNTELSQIAIQIANDLEGRNLHLHEEIQEAELHVAELRLQLESSRAARQRQLDFSPTLRGDFQCPFCWVRGGIKATITPKDGTDDSDVFVCKTCGERFTFEA